MKEKLFVAIGFDSDWSKRLALDVKKIKINLDKAEIEYRWIPSENYHVTMAFLGDIDDSRKLEVIDILKSIASLTSSFELNISGVDAFSSERDARVIFCGVQNKKNLRSLVVDLHQQLGLETEEEFSPHLTIARLRNSADVKDMISPLRRKDFFKIQVTEIRLYKSFLAGAYPSYKIIESFMLQPSQFRQSNEF